MPLEYHWTHDESRECAALASAIEAHSGRFPVSYREGAFVGGVYQLGIGDPWFEMVILDVTHSEPPVFKVLRGVWGTQVRDHPRGTPLIPAKRLYLEF